MDFQVVFVTEATGVYYESLACFLNDHDQQVVVLLPNKTKNYAGTLHLKSKTDKIDSRMLTRFCLEHQFRLLNAPAPIFKDLKGLRREYGIHTKFSVKVKNQLHAKEYSHKPTKRTVNRLRQQLKFLARQLAQIEKEIQELVSQGPVLSVKIDNIAHIKGVGFMTVVRVVAETNSFAIMDSRKPLASYVGLDIVHNRSGDGETKASICKKGYNFIRQALHMPALRACCYNKNMKDLYARTGIRKMRDAAPRAAASVPLREMFLTVN